MGGRISVRKYHINCSTQQRSNPSRGLSLPLKTPVLCPLPFIDTFSILSLFSRLVMSFLCISLLISFSSFLLAASILPAHAHEHRVALPDTWYHPRDHPLHALFRRSGDNIPTDGHYYPPVGSAGLFSIRHPRAYSLTFFTSKPG